jgi:hypothetical protein
MEDKGILLFAYNNREIDYVRIASVAARLAKKNIQVPISLVTDKSTVDWAFSQDTDLMSAFDNIILTDDLPKTVIQDKRYYDGSLDYKKTRFNNNFRTWCYLLSPYEKTLVIDIDLLIMNDKLKSIWDTDVDFMINADHFDLAQDRDDFEFKRTSDYGIDFYWATIFYFKKTEWTKTFFELCQHIVENYDFYVFTYRLPAHLMRNDYVFSIAVHIMNGFSNKTKPAKLPCQIYYTLDRDVLYKVNSEKDLTFFVEKKGYNGEYLLTRTIDQNVHIMNKYSLVRNIPALEEVLNVR